MRVEYSQLTLTKTELILAYVQWYSLIAIDIYSLYQSLIVALIGALPILYFAPKLQRRKKIMQEISRLKLQFKDLLSSINSSLAAGRALENCFRIAVQDLLLIYPSSQFSIIRELEIICSKLDNGEPLENSLIDFAQRSHVEEIKQFAKSIQTCKRSGGDLLSVMRKTTALLSEQIEINNEISIIVAQKKLESKIMIVAPFAFMLFMNQVASTYMENLYSGFGYLLISVIMLFLGLCFYIIHKITDIKL